MQIILLKLSLIGWTILPSEGSNSMFHPLLITALIVGTIRPWFLSFAMLVIIHPVPAISGSISVVVDPLTVGLVLYPIANVGISIRVNQSSMTVCSVVTPLTLVQLALWPYLPSVTVAFTVLPSTDIYGLILEYLMIVVCYTYGPSNVYLLLSIGVGDWYGPNFLMVSCTKLFRFWGSSVYGLATDSKGGSLSFRIWFG